MIMKVPARYFSPAPKVDSVVIAIRNISRKNFTSPQPSPYKGEGGNGTVQNKILNSQAFEQKFWEIVKAGFAHKRKKLSGNLKSKKDIPDIGNSYVNELGNKRAEDLTLADWLEITKEYNPSLTLPLSGEGNS
jgi:16S rRNA A1518/A1519 N6-dimethyltransferase RsmA/KsgA/DIM1 with predicted DNA glycosylase/AP lyase activity